MGRMDKLLLGQALALAALRYGLDGEKLPRPPGERKGTPPNPRRKNKAQKKAEKRQRQKERNDG